MEKRKPKRILKEEYEYFRNYLKEIKKNKIKLSMKEIEQIIGCDFLCDSAYTHKVWWSGMSHPLSKIWLEEGFKLKGLELGLHIVLVKNQTKLLKKIGFKKIGDWSRENRKLKHNISSTCLEERNLLYSFIVNDEIKYIGKTTNLLKQRMYQYQNPGPSQSTNIKNNKNILKLLEENENVEIYIFKEEKPIIYNDIRINLSAGLEDPLINKFKPEWNRVGK
ncbi:GIY-YIG nuclease family protein [Psychrilyobacter sp.]|uniref:GIY-YIG nuclease family protein n=1 Tax=Psychrilyobacter sp. TaxID=2586924 RepID=UPI00301982F4